MSDVTNQDYRALFELETAKVEALRAQLAESEADATAWCDKYHDNAKYVGTLESEIAELKASRKRLLKWCVDLLDKAKLYHNADEPIGDYRWMTVEEFPEKQEIEAILTEELSTDHIPDVRKRATPW